MCQLKEKQQIQSSSAILLYSGLWGFGWFSFALGKMIFTQSTNSNAIIFCKSLLQMPSDTPRTNVLSALCAALGLVKWQHHTFSNKESPLCTAVHDTRGDQVGGGSWSSHPQPQVLSILCLCQFASRRKSSEDCSQKVLMGWAWSGTFHSCSHSSGWRSITRPHLMPRGVGNVIQPCAGKKEREGAGPVSAV